MESTGIPGKIQVSQETAEILMASKKGKWVTEREERVIAKGKGSLQTYWLKIQSGSVGTGSASFVTGTNSVDNDDPDFRDGASQSKPSNMAAMGQLGEKECRLVNWNVELLKVVLQQIIARRQSLGGVKEQGRRESKMIKNGGRDNVLDEVKEVLSLPQFDAKSIRNHVDPRSIEIPDKVLSQLKDWVARIALSYQNNPFHSFGKCYLFVPTVSQFYSLIHLSLKKPIFLPLGRTCVTCNDEC